MNYRVNAYYLSMVLKLAALFLFVPLFISLYDREYSAVRGCVITMVLSLVLAIVLDILRSGGKQRERVMNTKEAFTLVALCWLGISFVGALPFYFSGAIPSFMDSVFESVSGFTTTGASILTNVEIIPRGLLFWRCFSQWIGGMGVLVFLLAASNGEHSVYVMKAESSGPMPGKLVPRLRQSSLILYGIYIAVTALQVILLMFGGLSLFDSVCCAMSTAGTGGFYIKNASLGFYNSAYIEIVTTFFMVLFGINFNMIYFLIIRHFRSVWKSEEFRVYIAIFTGTSLAIAANLLLSGGYQTFGRALRDSTFTVGSMMTSTGFYTADFNLWPEFSRLLLMIIVTIGASAGSTGGGLKVSRFIILVKEAKRILVRMSHPRSVGIVKLDGKAVDKLVVHHVTNYFVVYCFLAIASMILISFDNFDFESTVISVIACLGNAGPGLGMVGPVGNYSEFSIFSKIVLSLNMLFGRLEIYPLLLLFHTRTWRNL